MMIRENINRGIRLSADKTLDLPIRYNKYNDIDDNLRNAKN